MNRENCEKYPRRNLAQNSNVPTISQDDYITQVSEEIEGSVTKKLSEEFSKTENRILGAIARLDDFLTNPLIQGHFGTAAETSRNIFSFSQGTIEEESQSNPHPESGIFNNQMARNFGPEDDHDMVTGATEQSRNRHDMTGVHEEVTYCSPSTSSGKQKENHSTSQPHFCSDNTPWLKQTKVCWPFSSWQITTILQVSITILTEFPNGQSHLQQRCPRSTGNLKISSCLKIFSKQPAKSIIS